MLSVKQYARRKRISIPRVNQLIHQGRIVGAVKVGGYMWVIPDGAPIEPPLKTKHRKKRRKRRDTR